MYLSELVRDSKEVGDPCPNPFWIYSSWTEQSKHFKKVYTKNDNVTLTSSWTEMGKHQQMSWVVLQLICLCSYSSFKWISGRVNLRAEQWRWERWWCWWHQHVRRRGLWEWYKQTFVSYVFLTFWPKHSMWENNDGNTYFDTNFGCCLLNNVKWSVIFHKMSFHWFSLPLFLIAVTAVLGLVPFDCWSITSPIQTKKCINKFTPTKLQFTIFSEPDAYFGNVAGTWTTLQDTNSTQEGGSRDSKPKLQNCKADRCAHLSSNVLNWKVTFT